MSEIPDAPARPIGEIGVAFVGNSFLGVGDVKARRRLGVRIYGVAGSTQGRFAKRAAPLDPTPFARCEYVPRAHGWAKRGR